MLQAYDENIVRFTKEISEGRQELIQWKYFQYLSLLFTEIYLDKYFANPVRLLAELNEFVKAFNRKQIEDAQKKRIKAKDVFQAKPFEITELKKLAFWNATVSGKTLLMHINIKQYLLYATKYQRQHRNKVILIPPCVRITKQDIHDFLLSGIPTKVFQKAASQMFAGKDVEFLRSTKSSESPKE